MYEVVGVVFKKKKIGKIDNQLRKIVWKSSNLYGYLRR